VPVGPWRHGLHALRHAHLVSGPCDRCTPQAGRVEGGEEKRGPVRVFAELQRTWAMEVRPGVRRVRWVHRTGSFSGYESTTMYSRARRTTIVVVSTKQPNAITPPPMFQALAMAIFGTHIGFGLTPCAGPRAQLLRRGPRRLSGAVRHQNGISAPGRSRTCDTKP
jgi:hypothetical protein